LNLPGLRFIIRTEVVSFFQEFRVEFATNRLRLIGFAMDLEFEPFMDLFSKLMSEAAPLVDEAKHLRSEALVIRLAARAMVGQARSARIQSEDNRLQRLRVKAGPATSS
jgi:hypothetical protein